MQIHKKTLQFPAIEPKFTDGRVPPGFVNDVRGWTATRPQVEDAVKNGRLLTLDIDMAGHGACSLRCGHCFRRSEGFRNEKRLNFEELALHLREAKSLGLLSAKIIGPGEPLEDRMLFPLLKLMADLDVIPLVFTKGHVLGDDMRCMQIHGLDGDQLAMALMDMGATILLGATSFDGGLEDQIVGRKGYHAARARAIVRLIDSGFTDFIPGEATRLGISFSPVTPDNIDEAFEVHKWARERHIQPILAPTIIAGKAKAHPDLIVRSDAMVDLYARLNIDAIQRGILTIEELRAQGISSYGSAAPCNQLSVGMFMRGDGKVLRCPGNDTSILGDLREKSLTQIWEENGHLRRFRDPMNNLCPPKLAGGSYPEGFFAEAERMVEEHLLSEK